MIINVHRTPSKVLILLRLEFNFNFLDRFSTNTRISNFIKIRPLRAELFHSDRQEDMTKLIVALRNIANAPKNDRINYCVESTYYLTC
jgi:hypothetical protein